jgi:hypothetical protein
MPSDARRVQFSIRLRPEDKAAFSEAAERCGIDPSVAARQLIELVVQRLQSGGDLFDAIHELKSTWRVPRRSELEIRLDALTKALSTFKPADDQTALVDKIEAVEKELQERGRRGGLKAGS